MSNASLCCRHPKDHTKWLTTKNWNGFVDGPECFNVPAKNDLGWHEQKDGSPCRYLFISFDWLNRASDRNTLSIVWEDRMVRPYVLSSEGDTGGQKPMLENLATSRCYSSVGGWVVPKIGYNVSFHRGNKRLWHDTYPLLPICIHQIMIHFGFPCCSQAEQLIRTESMICHNNKISAKCSESHASQFTRKKSNKHHKDNRNM